MFLDPRFHPDCVLVADFYLFIYFIACLYHSLRLLLHVIFLFLVLLFHNLVVFKICRINKVDWIGWCEHRDSPSIPICNVCAIFLNLVVMESANIKKKAADLEDLDLIFFSPFSPAAFEVWSPGSLTHWLTDPLIQEQSPRGWRTQKLNPGVSNETVS